MGVSDPPADQLFYNLHPRARVFPELWKVVSQRALKLHGITPEQSINERHLQSSLKCWLLPTVGCSRQCLQILALQPRCDKQE